MRLFLFLITVFSFSIPHSEQIHLSRDNLAQMCNCNIHTIQRIDFLFRNITSVDPLTFRNLTNLRVISLDGNQLTSVDENLYQGLINLIWIDLDRNFLTYLPPRLFSGLVNLEVLDLFNNKISFLNETIFQGLPRLKMIWLQSNPLHVIDNRLFHGLTSLRELRLDNHNFNDLDRDTFRDLSNLETLNLNAIPGNSSFRIMKIDDYTFHGLYNLKTLKLEYNKIALFSKNALVGLKNLERVCLYGNSITWQSPELIKDICNQNPKCQVFTTQKCDDKNRSNQMMSIDNLIYFAFLVVYYTTKY